MPYVKRNAQNVICGCFTHEQTDAREFLTEADPEVVAYRNPPPPSADELEQRCLDALQGTNGGLDLLRLAKAKIVSDLAFRLGRAPGQLTAQEIQAERARLAAIYKAL